MRTKLNITEEESKRILSLHNESANSKKNIISEEKPWWTNPNSGSVKKTVKNGVLTLYQDITLENATTTGGDELKLFKGAKFKISKPGLLVSDTKYQFMVSYGFKEQTSDVTKGKILYNCYSGKFSVSKDKNKIVTNSSGNIAYGGNSDTFYNEDFSVESAGFKYMCYLSTQTNQQKVQGGGSDNQQKSKVNKDGWGKLNKTNGTYTLRYNQPLKASVDFNTVFPKNIPAGTVVYHDYKKNDNKIILGNTGVVAYCNRNTFIYNDGIDDLKNDGLMSTLKGIFCNGDKIKTWKELTYTPVENTGDTGDTGDTGNTGNTTSGGGGQTYPFDYNTILNAFPKEDIVNPFEQGGEEGDQPIVVTDKTFGLF